MTDSSNSPIEIRIPTEDPFSGSSLVPMLVGALVLIVIGMIAVWSLA